MDLLQTASRRPAALTLALIGVVGAGIGVYLTDVHYQGAPLVCAANGVVNCERVLTSSYSTVAGVPVSVGAILWFVATFLLALVALVRPAEPRWLQPVQAVWSLLGLGVVLYLVGVEVVALGVICAWCTGLHVLIVVALLISVLRTPAPEPATRADRVA